MNGRLFEYSIEEQIQCIERETGLREFVYPRWVEAERMTQQKADYEIATMRAVLDTLRAVLLRHED